MRDLWPVSDAVAKTSHPFKSGGGGGFGELCNSTHLLGESLGFLQTQGSGLGVYPVNPNLI